MLNHQGDRKTALRDRGMVYFCSIPSIAVLCRNLIAIKKKFNHSSLHLKFVQD